MNIKSKKEILKNYLKRFSLDFNKKCFYFYLCLDLNFNLYFIYNKFILILF